MPRTNRDGKEIKLELCWLTGRFLTDEELYAALGITKGKYISRKDADDYPTYEELEQFANHFGLNACALQIAFGLRAETELILLDDDGMAQYIEQGGGGRPEIPRDGSSSDTPRRRGWAFRPDRPGL